MPGADTILEGIRDHPLPFLPSTAVDYRVSSDCLSSKRLAGGRQVGKRRLITKTTWRPPFGWVQKTLEEID
jgi:hypothetical protein